MTLPAKLAQLGKADILLTYAERLPRGRGYVVRFVPFDGDLSGTRPSRRQHQPRHGAADRALPVPVFLELQPLQAPQGVAAPEAEVAA
jgi:KDO2-lipid IV(A) lauroyltransferase